MLILISLLASVLLESTVSTLPLTLLVILFGAIKTRKNEIFLLAFLSGLFLDILTIRTPSLSGLYFVVFVFVIFLYQKKFEIESIPFISSVSFLGGLGYLILIGAKSPIIQALITAFIMSLSFLVFNFFTKPSKNTRHGSR